MDVVEQLTAGIKRIQSGWIKGDLADEEGFCLVGALNAGMDYENAYTVTPGIEKVCAEIVTECDICAEKYALMVADWPEYLLKESDVVWSHNDWHISSQEDALLILKKALAEV